MLDILGGTYQINHLEDSKNLGTAEMAQWLSACCAVMGTEFLSQHPRDKQTLVILAPREQIPSSSLHTFTGAHMA